MNCPKCGTVLADASPFCSTCGTNLSAAGTGPMQPGMPGMPAMPGQGFGQYNQGGFGMPPEMMIAPRTSGMAIAGFVLAFFCSLLGLIFSIIGYNECRGSMGMVKGEGLALAGIIISILSMLAGFALVVGGHR